MKSWGLAAVKGLGLDESTYVLSGVHNIFQTGEHGWYQGKGVVNATPITFAEFFAALPKVLEDTVCSTALPPKRSSNDAACRKLEPSLVQLKRDMLAAHRAGGRVVFIGNGGSAAIASHMAVDFTKNGGIRAVAFNDVPTLTCLANDFGYDNVFAKQLEYYAERRDIVVIISSSGRSLNILAAARTAKMIGCRVITFTGMNPNNALRALGDFNFWVPSADYGLVELSHLSLLHAVASVPTIEEAAARWPRKKKVRRK